MSYQNILKIACDMEKSIIDRHELNEIEDYDGTYELEQDQRDMGLALADAIINDFNDYDTLVDENKKMAEYLLYLHECNKIDLERDNLGWLL